MTNYWLLKKKDYLTENPYLCVLKLIEILFSNS